MIFCDFREFPDNLALIYCCGDKILHLRTYQDVSNEAEQLIHVFKDFPKGVVVAVQLGHKPCLLPVIYCLLQQEITFMLFEEEENFENVDVDVQFYALVTCKLHGNEENTQEKQFKNRKRSVLRTNLGCEYHFFIFDFPSLEEKAKSYHGTGICYIISTSGTLGRRKLVKVTENAIFSNIQSFSKIFEISNLDVIYFGTPLSFDPSLVEIFLAFQTGACLLATTKRTRNNPMKLMQALFSRKHKITNVTFMQMCPSFFLQFSTQHIAFILDRKKSGLRILGLGGEPFPTHILLPSGNEMCRIFNFYGITEVSCWASVEEVFHTGDEVSLGAPLDDTTFQLQDYEGNVINCWENQFDDENCYEGILYIGTKRRICYVNDEDEEEERKRPEENEKVIYRNTGDIVTVKSGKVYYKGRVNDIIKRFGRRVCLLKVQETIYNSTQLPNICMFYHEKLICFLQIENFQNHKVKDKITDKIHVKLLKDLVDVPEYIPDFYDILASFPVKKLNGKVDKLVLEQLADCFFNDRNAKSSIVQIQVNLKEIFADLWYKYLLGMKMNERSNENIEFAKKTFWESGGNSILAMQLAEEFNRLTNGELNRSLFDLTLESALDFLQSNSENLLKTAATRGKSFKVLWKSDMKACIDSTPTISKFGENVFVAVGNFAHIFSVFEGNSGLEVATITLPNVVESATLIEQNDIFVPCFDGKLYSLRLHLAKESHLEGLWTFQTGDRLKNKPCFDINEQQIVFGSYDGYVYALSKEGTLKWKTLISEPVTAEIKAAHGKLYVAGLKGCAFCLKSKDGKMLWKHKGKNPMFAEPELAEEIVLFVDIESCFYSFSIETDALLWIYDPQKDTMPTSTHFKTFAPMFCQKHLIFLGAQNGNINIFEFNETKCTLTLQESCKDKVTSPITTKPLHLRIKNNDYLIVVNSIGCLSLYSLVFKDIGSDDVKFLHLDLADEYLLPNECFSSPQKCIFYENRFYVGCRDNNLYCVEVSLDV